MGEFAKRFPSTVAILLCDEDADEQHARQIASHLDIQLVSSMPPLDCDDTFLHLSARGLSLERGELSICPDFSLLLPRLAPGKLHRELVVRAAKLKGQCDDPLAIDATAGLGEDALFLAAYGYTVHLYERDPVIAALLRDAISRAVADPDIAEYARRMLVFEQDSIEAMEHLDRRPDIIYLDPMFPERKKSAAVKKKFQLLHEIESSAQDEEELLNAALRVNPRKIIIKRPLKGPQLAGYKPSYALLGKAVRFDCIVAP